MAFVQAQGTLIYTVLQTVMPLLPCSAFCSFAVLKNGHTLQTVSRGHVHNKTMIMIMSCMPAGTGSAFQVSAVSLNPKP